MLGLEIDVEENPSSPSTVGQRSLISTFTMYISCVVLLVFDFVGLVWCVFKPGRRFLDRTFIIVAQSKGIFLDIF
jgi:hypothetical protein